MDHLETELEFDGQRYLRVPVQARLREATVDELPSFVHPVVQATAAKSAKQMYWQDKENPDLVWVNFILDSEGINKNWDYMPRSQLLASHHTAKYKPMDMDHIIKEEKSLVGMDKANPPTKNTIFGVMTNTALADATGKLLTDKQIAALDGEDDPERPAEDRITVVAWAALYYFLFPKTVARLVDVIKTGALHVSMERWLREWDFIVGKSDEGFDTYTREDAEKKGLFAKWQTRQTHNGGPVIRRTLAYTYGGVASTANPANQLSRYLDQVKPSKVKAAASYADDPVVANLVAQHDSVVAAYAAADTDDERGRLVTQHNRIHKALDAYVG